MLVIHISALLISCKNADQAADKMVFRYNSSTGITSLDPAFARSQENIRAVNQVFNGLLQLDDSLHLIACIAKDWSISDNGTLYTFILRNDVFFHNHAVFNGVKRKVVASDFVYSFNRIIQPSTASDGAWIFNGIVAEQAPFVALNDTTLQIRLTRSFAPFENLLTMAYCAVVPHEAVEAMQGDFGKHPVGTGPFRFGQWQEGIKLNLLKNEDYFESTARNPIPRVDAVSISFIQSKQTELLEFIQGNLDVFSGLESSFKDEILDANGDLQPNYAQRFVLNRYPFLNTEYLAFNLSDSLSPVQNSALRKAMSMAVNRENMVRYLRNNVGHPAKGGFTPFGLPGHTEHTNTHNIARARFIVDSLNIHFDAPIVLTTTKDYLDLCILVQKDLRSISIPVAIDVVPSALLKQQKSAGELAFFRSSWIADYPDAENYMACFYSKNEAPNGPNYTRFSNPQFDALYEALLETTAAPEKIECIQKMEKVLHSEMPFIILYYDQSIWLKQLGVQNLKVNALNQLDLRWVAFK